MLNREVRISDGDEVNTPATALLVFAQNFLHRFPLACLSHPHTVADGACFLCTNQGGIRSLTDMSPMTPVSIHINYSSSVRWMLPRVGRQRREGRNRGRWKREITHSSSHHTKVLLTSACPPTRHSPPRTVVRVITRQNHLRETYESLGLRCISKWEKKDSAQKEKNSKCPLKSVFSFPTFNQCI